MESPFYVCDCLRTIIENVHHLCKSIDNLRRLIFGFLSGHENAVECLVCYNSGYGGRERDWTVQGEER